MRTTFRIATALRLGRDDRAPPAGNRRPGRAARAPTLQVAAALACSAAHRGRSRSGLFGNGGSRSELAVEVQHSR